MFFYIFIKIIVCHSIYIFAKWVILLLCCIITCNGHDFPWKHEYHIYLIFKKWCPQYIRFFGCLQSYFCSVLQKALLQLFYECIFFHIFWNICIVNFVSFPPPLPQKNLKIVKLEEVLFSTIYGPLCGSFFDQRSGSSYKKTIFFKLTCFSIHITNINGWSKT